MSPLVAKILHLAGLPFSSLPPSLSSSSDLVPCPPTHHPLPTLDTPSQLPLVLFSLLPWPTGVTETLTLRSHSFVPGLSRTYLPILAKASKFHSKVKSKLTYQLHLCSCDMIVAVFKCQMNLSSLRYVF
jgi:hypothetical protein